MYREKIREYYDHLSRSYRRVADFIMSKYYEVSFMTAAQLAYAVGVDTTTVVRFSQRLGYNGYPELLHDIREQVKSEIYAAYEPKPLNPDNPAGTFKDRIEHEQHNLRQMLVHNPPELPRRSPIHPEDSSKDGLYRFDFEDKNLHQVMQIQNASEIIKIPGQQK